MSGAVGIHVSAGVSGHISLHSIHGSERPDTRSPGSGDGRAPLQSSVTQDDGGPGRLGVRRPGKGLLAPASMTGQQRWQNAAVGKGEAMRPFCACT